MGLKQKRRAFGLSQRKAAGLFNLTYRTYQNYENGVTSPPMSTAARFARYFGCTIGELFDLQEGPHQTLSPDEAELIEWYRSVGTTERRQMRKIMDALAIR